MEGRFVLRRKLVHLAGTMYIFLLWLFAGWWGLPAATFTLTAITMFLMGIYVIYQYLKFLGRPPHFLSEIWHKVGSPEYHGQSEYWDVCWLGVGLSIAAVICALTEEIAIAYIMACSVILGDGLAALGGTYLGKHKLGFNPQKSVEGSLLGFTAATAASLLLTQNFTLSLLGAGTGAIVEALPWRASDNASIPLVVVGILLTYKTLLHLLGG